MKLNNRPAIYIPFAQAIPNVAVIDTEQCIKMKTGKCGLCQKVCSAGAINYEQKDEFIEREYGAIVVATGFRQPFFTVTGDREKSAAAPTFRPGTLSGPPSRH